ncbi:MAG: ABC transporter ATP-binding protein [Lachnospiraceae bacterium]|nr:ABC transporter ATP-binding protein [Lachnospiraceae bacterium]
MFKTLGKYVKEYKKASVATPIFMIIEVILETLIPFLMASIIDDGVNKGNMGHIVKIGIVMFVLAIGGLAAGVLGGVYGAKASTGLAKNLREGMFDKIQTFSFSNIDKFSTAGLITRLTTDVTNVQNAYQMLLRMCFRAPVCIIFAMFMAFMINARLAMVYLVAVIVLGTILFSIIKIVSPMFGRTFKKYDELNANVQENISGIRVVKAYVREKYENSKFYNSSNNIYSMFVKIEKILILNSPVMMFTVYTCIILISWFGAHMIVSDSLTKGELTSLLAYCMNILMNLMMLSMVFVMMSMSQTSAKRIAEVLNETPDISNPENPVMEVKDGSILFDNVSFMYNMNAEDNQNSDRKPVLRDINLSISSGETIGILGGTGSSKSTLVNLISRLYDTTSGTIKVGGVDVKEYDLDVLRKEVSVVLQKNVLFTGTIYENLRWGDPDATDEECKKACELACASEFIDKMPNGYNTVIEQGGANVSGGQRQRLCIARALLKKPKILNLYDSTSAVDTATDAKIRKAFAEEIPNTTKIIIAQRVASIQNSDRIVVLDDGEIVGVGTHEQLMKNNEIYREIYETQTSGSGDFDEQRG